MDFLRSYHISFSFCLHAIASLNSVQDDHMAGHNDMVGTIFLFCFANFFFSSIRLFMTNDLEMIISCDFVLK